MHFFATNSLTSNQRSHVNLESVKFPDFPADEDDTGDDHESSEPESATEADDQFKRHVEDSDAAFVEHRTGRPGLTRLRNSTLRAMCSSKELGEGGKKEDLVNRLMDWVSLVSRSVPTLRFISLPSAN